jgi:hypothetical protein
MTPGMITIMENNKVIMKIVAGSNGFNAPTLAEEIKKAWPLSIFEVYALAVVKKFGDERTYLVVLDEEKILFSQGDDNISTLYRATFHRPAFNPRGAQGTTEYYELIMV